MLDIKRDHEDRKISVWASDPSEVPGNSNCVRPPPLLPKLQRDSGRRLDPIIAPSLSPEMGKAIFVQKKRAGIALPFCPLLAARLLYLVHVFQTSSLLIEGRAAANPEADILVTVRRPARVVAISHAAISSRDAPHAAPNHPVRTTLRTYRIRNGTTP